jgi:hypothetical protein
VTASPRRKGGAPVREVLESDDVRSILRDGFFSTAPNASGVHAVEPIEEATDADSGRKHLTTAQRARKTSKKSAKERPDHYKVICISLYNDDLALLDRVVKDLKKRGFTKANRSAVLRAAMQQFDPAKVAKGL